MRPARMPHVPTCQGLENAALAAYRVRLAAASTRRATQDGLELTAPGIQPRASCTHNPLSGMRRLPASGGCQHSLWPVAMMFLSVPMLSSVSLSSMKTSCKGCIAVSAVLSAMSATDSSHGTHTLSSARRRVSSDALPVRVPAAARRNSSSSALHSLTSALWPR